MRAVEYAASVQKVVEEGGDLPGALKEAAGQMLAEVSSLARERGVKTDSGLFGVVHEIDLKWRAMCKRLERLGIGGANAEGFQRVWSEVTRAVERVNTTAKEP